MRRISIITIFIIMSLLAAACSSTPAPTATATESPTETAEPTTAPSETPTAAATDEPTTTTTGDSDAENSESDPAPAAATDDVSAVIEYEADGIVIGNPWLRPARTASTAAYMSITNTTDNPITLVEASVDFAAMTRIHETTVQNDVARMEEIEDGLTIEAGETIFLQPASYHLMVMNIDSPIEGGTRQITLTFDNGTTITIDATVSDQSPSRSQ